MPNLPRVRRKVIRNIQSPCLLQGKKALRQITYHTRTIYPTYPISLYQTNQQIIDQKKPDRLTTSYQPVPLYTRPTHAIHYIPIQHVPSIITTPRLTPVKHVILSVPYHSLKEEGEGDTTKL